MIKIADSHNDFMTKITAKEKDCYLSHCQKVGVKIISCAIFTTNLKLNISDISNFNNELTTLNKKFKDLTLLLSIEDIGFIKESDIEKLIKLRPICCTLTWNFDNQLAGGALGGKSITKFGEEVIHKLENENIFVDTAHMNKKSFWKFCKLTKKPIYNSHSNIYDLKRHKRNLTDKQIEMIVKSKGYLGLTIYDKFVGKEGKVDSKIIALQFDYLIKKFGYKNFGFGTDFYGIDTNNLPKDIKSYEDIEKIARELKKLGYSEKIIECITYKNYEDFLKRNNLISFEVSYD